MSLQLKPVPDGDYVLTLGHSHDDAKAEARRTLRNNGCANIRYQIFPDGRMVAHGYLKRDLHHPQIESLVAMQ
jgi:hypothetical protein